MNEWLNLLYCFVSRTFTDLKKKTARRRGPRKTRKRKKEVGVTEGSRQRGRRPKRVDPERIMMGDLRETAREEQCNEQCNRKEFLLNSIFLVNRALDYA